MQTSTEKENGIVIKPRLVFLAVIVALLTCSVCLVVLFNFSGILGGSSAYKSSYIKEEQQKLLAMSSSSQKKWMKTSYTLTEMNCELLIYKYDEKFASIGSSTAESFSETQEILDQNIQIVRVLKDKYPEEIKIIEDIYDLSKSLYSTVVVKKQTSSNTQDVWNNFYKMQKIVRDNYPHLIDK